MKKGSSGVGADSSSSGRGRGGSKVFIRSDGSFYFEVDSTPEETNVVSWKKLLMDHAAGACSASRPSATPNPCPDARIAPNEYFQVDNSATKYNGYFVQRGKLEEVELSMLPNEQSKKKRGKDLAKGSDGCDNDPNPSKPRKNARKSAQENNTPGLSVVIALPIQANSSASKTDSKTREQVSEAGSVATISNVDPEKITTPEAQPVYQQQKLVSEPRDRRIILRIPFTPMKARLENAIEDLEKLVAEFGQDDSSSQASRRRLPREIKDKLAEVVGYALSSYGKIIKELVDRLLDIVGHLVGRKTLKRNLKKMVDAELSAKQERDSIQ